MASMKRTQRTSKLRISSTAESSARADPLKPRLIDSLASTTTALKNLFKPAAKPEEKEFIVATPPSLHRSNSSRLTTKSTKSGPPPLLQRATTLKSNNRLKNGELGTTQATSGTISGTRPEVARCDVLSGSSLYSSKDSVMTSVAPRTTAQEFKSNMTSSSVMNSVDSFVTRKFRDNEFSVDSAYNTEIYIASDWKPSGISSFSVYKMIGKGAFSKVYLCRRRVDGKIYALKSMRKDLILKMRQVEHIHNEKRLMLQASNPFITTLYWTLQDPIHLFMVMEYMGGGDLFNQIKTNGRFDNHAGQFYAGEIFLGLSSLHAQDIVYRDLKPENVLVDFEGHVKLADFGFAKQIPGTTKTFCGTPSYIAPEVILRQEYTTIVDWWTFGILVFEMLSGCSPFQDENSKKTYERIVQGRIRWPSNPLKYFSEEANDLISSLLVLSPSKRLGARAEKDIQCHPWFSTLDWSGLEDRRIKPPIAIKNSRQRSESMGARSYQSMGSGNLGLRIENKDLQTKYGSNEGMGATGDPSEMELELSSGGTGALQGEKSWSGNKNPNHGSATNLFVDF